MKRLLLPLYLTFFASGCLHVTMDVHAVVDVNVRVQQALTDFFGDLDQKSATITNTP